ncbi:hypothetical protein AVEN_251841-1 [Araneus ventricosus]|uniref:Uncharacterized protein n=1 Tax=Araneus ventricosus TaxID=182803 RepID=A0A4Y2FXF9_ARAVE|nr:hypothetical protein AVEN_251841-1 [Araneus ventricosus]
MRPQWHRVAGSKPHSIGDPPCMGPVARQIISSDQKSFRWCGAEVLRRGRVPALVSSSSSERGSKFRGPILNSPCVASKTGR